VVVLTDVKMFGRWGFEVAACKECPALFPERHVKYYNDEYTSCQPHNKENPYPDMQFHRFGGLCINLLSSAELWGRQFCGETG
jgi:hypothetical protein